MSEALGIYEACQGERDPEYFGILNDLGLVWLKDDRFREADDAWRRVADNFRETEGADSWHLLLVEALRAECSWKLGDLPAAERELLRCFKRLVETKGEDFPQLPKVAAQLVRFYEGTGRAAEAEPYRAIASRKSAASSQPAR